MGKMVDSGIYTITSPSGNCYVGSAFDFAKRWRVHVHHLRNKTHHSAALQSAWDKYGEAGMVFARILCCPKDLLIMYEQCAMDALTPKYNMKLVAGNASGWKHSEEARKKMSMQRTGIAQTPERVAARVAKLVGRKRDPAAIERSAMAQRGRVKSALEKERISASLTGRKAGPMSDAHKKKIGEANKGRIASDEARAKNSAAKTGIKQSPETIAKRVAARSGYRHSQETIEKMRAAKALRKISQ